MGLCLVSVRGGELCASCDAAHYQFRHTPLLPLAHRDSRFPSDSQLDHIDDNKTLMTAMSSIALPVLALIPRHGTLCVSLPLSLSRCLSLPLSRVRSCTQSWLSQPPLLSSIIEMPKYIEIMRVVVWYFFECNCNSAVIVLAGLIDPRSVQE